MKSKLKIIRINKLAYKGRIVKNVLLSLAMLFLLAQPLLAQNISNDNARAVINESANSVLNTACKKVSNNGVEINANSTVSNGKSGDKPYLPTNVQAELNESLQGVVTWDIPSSMVFRYDDGTIQYPLGYNSTDNSILGSVFFENTMIEKATWYTTSSVSHDSVDLVILGLDENNMPDLDNVIYWETHANFPDSWTEVEFEEDIAAPNGYFIGLHTDGNISMGSDTGEDPEWPFVYGVHYGIGDYTGDATSWKLLEDMDLNYNLLIRTEGYTLADSKSSKSVLSYNLYRIDTLTDTKSSIATNVQELTYTDVDLLNQDAGYYYYAVTAVYPDEVESDYSYSNEVSTGMHVEFTVNVNSDSDKSLEGAYVRLTNQNGDMNYFYSMQTSEGGMCIFPKVFKGTYNLDVALDGHLASKTEGVVIDGEGSVSITLSEELWKPDLNDAVVSNDTAILSWNKVYKEFFDDFEGHDDFVISFPPWVSINADGGRVMAMYDVFYDNAGDPQAGIIYNPKETLPRVGKDAYSGDKYLAIFNAWALDTDKWNISPKVLAKSGYEITIQAAAGSITWSEEEFQICVSTEGPSIEDMVPLSPVVTLPADYSAWDLYTFDLSEYAEQDVYIGIHCTSYDQFFLLLDDFYVGPANNTDVASSSITYNIYLDDMENPIATQIEDTSYLFTGCESRHVLGVQAIQDAGVSEIVTQVIGGNDISESQSSNQLSIYPNPAKDRVNIVSDQEIERITVYSVLGRLVYESMNSQNRTVQLNTTDYEPGIYMIKVKSAQNSSTEFISIIK